ncbi:P-loop ATPase, Sll1717 family [Caulobacter segnis]|uniref:TIR domain-containing protein n=1 Tax=Caulobacter segnis TaxID=88688 RepID=A0A2W5UUT0_9CAUL|nr:hypothetical protein [Caulobacter segnis]PZR31479.1 MAG: hypothetical protein DI526_19555 [Caulobacter segnis]
MARKINCFVSFSAADGNERNIRFLIEYLTERLEGKVSFQAYFDQPTGSDLQNFMKDELTKAEAVIALFTPDYKRKIEQRITSGVLTEYLRIVDRLEGKIDAPPLAFLPIFWGGPSFEAAAPTYFMGRNFARELNLFQAYGSEGEPYLPDRIETLLRPAIGRIVSDLKIRWDEADPSYATLKAAVDETMLAPAVMSDEDQATSSQDSTRPDGRVDEAMFRKSERAPLSVADFSRLYFVKTAAFRAIGRHHKMAFTGRKGSGKTTLLKVYKHQNEERYFLPIDVEVNDWNLHYILGDLTFRPAEGDLSYTAEESKVFDFVWPIFLSLCMVRSLEGAHPYPEHLLSHVEHSRRFSSSKGRYDQLFQLSIEIVTEFIQECIDSASTRSEGEFKSDLLRSLNVQACTERLLGPGYGALLEIVRRDSRQRRFLFCLDRFDTEIQKYRKDLSAHNISDEERRRREGREVFWIQGLVEMIDHLRSPDHFSLNQEFYKKIGPLVDFCVPLPKDRLYEVQLRRRDAIVGDINEEINWQPYELLTMLRKRLQVIWRISDAHLDKEHWPNARDRYDRVIELSRRKMPKTSEIRMNGAVFQTDLFLNVLRHTFFRPRDVIIYYARIVLAVEAAHRRTQPLNTATIGRLISEQTYKIVEEEFLGEFSDTFKNLRVVLHRFRGAPQLMELKELKNKLDDVRFEIYGEDDIVDLGPKIRFLYEIGFIGVSANGSQIGNISAVDYDFYFFNPRVAQNLEELAVLESVKFAIHPVFIEYLTLRLNAAKPVMLLTWDKIDELDAYD